MSIDGQVWQEFQRGFIGDSKLEVILLRCLLVAFILIVLWILSNGRN